MRNWENQSLRSQKTPDDRRQRADDSKNLKTEVRATEVRKNQMTDNRGQMTAKT